MLNLELTDKKHDEGRQGETFSALAQHFTPYQKHFYIESYGCQMNFADSEIVASILQQEGFGATTDIRGSRSYLSQHLFYPRKSRANRQKPVAAF